MARTLSRAVRAALEDAVDEVVYELGAHEGTLDEICRRAGVGKPSLYRHLGPRDDVLVDYLERRRVQRNALLLQAMDAAREGRPHVDALVDWFATWIESDDFADAGFIGRSSRGRLTSSV